MKNVRRNWMLALVFALGASVALPTLAVAQETRMLLGTGMHDEGFLCDGVFSCPAAATTSGGETMEMSGEAVFGVPTTNSVIGFGSYRHTDAAGALVDAGTWTADFVQQFVELGGSLSLPTGWIQGRIFVEITMVSQFDGTTSSAILEAAGKFFDPVTPAPTAIIKGMRLSVVNGPNFENAVEPRAVLFISEPGAPVPPDDPGGEPGGGALEGSTLAVEWAFSGLSTPLEGPTNFVVGAGVDLSGFVSNSINIDVNGDQFCLIVTKGLFFSSAGFNGLIFRDSANAVDPFATAIASAANTVPGFGPARVSVSANAIEVDLGGLNTMAGEQACFRVGF